MVTCMLEVPKADDDAIYCYLLDGDETKISIGI